MAERNDRLAACQTRSQLQVDPWSIQRKLATQDDKDVCFLQVRQHAIHPVITDGDTRTVRRHIHVDQADERLIDVCLDQVAELRLTAGVTDKYLDWLHCALALPSNPQPANPTPAWNNAEWVEIEQRLTCCRQRLAHRLLNLVEAFGQFDVGAPRIGKKCDGDAQRRHGAVRHR